MTTDSIVMWVTRLSIVDWVYFKTQTLLATLTGRVFCIFGSRTFVPISWMCKKQTSVSHSSTETDIISLDAGLRMDGILALGLWDVVIEVSRSTNDTARHNKLAQGNVCTTGDHSINKHQTKTPTEKRKREVQHLSNVDYVPTNTHSSQSESQVYIFENNEAVIKMIIKGRSPTMRHVSRTHRVALDWLFDRINVEPKIQIKHVDTKSQLADMLTKGSFTRDEWNHPVRLFNIMSFSMLYSSHFSNFLSDPIGKQNAMSQRGQEATSSEGSPMAKQNQRLQRRRDPSTWCYAVRGARGKILRRIWDIRSTGGVNLLDL